MTFPEWDTELFLRLNGAHSDLLDPLMTLLSSSRAWIPLYLLIVFFMIRKEGWYGLICIALMLLSFGLADRLSVILFKENFQRLRPCYVEELQGIVRSLEACGGRYGFVSNHAANTFCLATFVSMLFRNRGCTLSIFIWATAVSYSRIYVGKHYPLDVICGAAFGSLCGFAGFAVYLPIVCLIKKKLQQKNE
ncbi:MAG: phosphatase PAP2 family protein [Prevotellaceae bacterium]|jgi:undecaprenyl-diphosphatase|nr:phosphatase PAP2 family protein [Prevotellaceae bacterium]